ncbi:MAG TPA: SpoIIE family protein phosphatase [Solirubrobacteraceae bacterium]|nr:SpoIIE family protein phosphatase [Solirubrobacteraceae bacterium]
MAGRVDTPNTRGDSEAMADLTAVESLPILLVDDQPENLRTLEAVLEPLGYPLVTSSSGHGALRLLLERDFSMILLDVRMPGLDGLETARLIKERTRTSDIPIVFLTASRDDVPDIMRGYSVGAVDYMLKPFDPELLRSKVLVFVELETSRRALKRSEALLSGAFEAAPIGKTVLDAEGRIMRPNPAFANLVGRDPDELVGIPAVELCEFEDRPALTAAFDEVTRRTRPTSGGERPSLDLRLVSSTGAEVWVAMFASAIEAAEFAEPLMLAQWVDLTVRRRAEQDRAELLLEQAARVQAESVAERLSMLQSLTSALEALTLDELLPRIAARLAELFDVDVAEVEIAGELDRPVVVRAVGGHTETGRSDSLVLEEDRWRQVPLVIEGANVGSLRLGLPAGRSFSATERSLLQDAADRAALAIRRAQLHEEEHRIAVELQRGLIPKSLPAVPGVSLAASYEVAGIGVQVGGDWYDAFTLSDGRLGIVVGDVTGRGIRAASAMGQLRTLTRAFALGGDGQRAPGQALTLLNRHQLALGDDHLFTIVYAIVDPEHGTISWANGGHPPPLLRESDGACRWLEGGNGLMGVDDKLYETFEETIDPSSTVVLYTDGLVERRGESLDVGLERLASAACAGPEEPGQLRDHILAALTEESGQLYDDVTAVVARLGR